MLSSTTARSAVEDIKHIRFVPKPGRMLAFDPVSDDVGMLLVHNILVRKGQPLIKYPNGRLRPVAQAVMNKNMIRLRANENPADIIRDMQVQLQLL